jgi:hypothetical protein
MPQSTPADAMAAASTALPAARRLDLPAPQRRGRWRHFYVVLAVLYTVLAIVGFTPSFVVGPPIPVVAYVHGALMAGWLALFLMQTRLAAAGELSRHRELGRAGAWFAVAIWLSMVVAMVTGHVRQHPPVESFLYDVLMVELALIVLFAVFFGWAILFRGRPAWHRRLMALATLVLVQAGLDRMGWQPLPGPMLVWILLVPFVVFDVVTTRRVHPATLIGAALIIASHVMIIVNWGNPAWHAFAQGLFSRLQ